MAVILSAITNFYSLQYVSPLPVEDHSITISCRKRQFLFTYYCSWLSIKYFRSIQLQRDPCLLEKFQKIYSNTTVNCNIECRNKRKSEIKLDPYNSKEDGSSVFVPLLSNDLCHVKAEDLLCSVECQGQLGRYFSFVNFLENMPKIKLVQID